MKHANYIVPPGLFIRHTPERGFIGPGTVCLDDGTILMAAPWGHPGTDFGRPAAPLPMLYGSGDGGRTWRELGPMQMEWDLEGRIADGGITLLRLQDGRLAFLAHRHVKGLHGGGLPVISFSENDGRSWTPARTIGAPEGVWYVMNDRMIQMRNGRMVVPVSHMPSDMGTYEGDRNLGLCFFSDDAGVTWRRSSEPASLDDTRGMAEPCVAEVGDGRLLMLARTGSGCNHASWSQDGGETWSSPRPTTQTAACSSLTLKKMPDGRLMVFYNHTVPFSPGAYFPRTPLCYSVSPDEGLTWDHAVVVDDEGVERKDRQNIYPSVTFTDEGMLVLYSTHAADPGGQFVRSPGDIGGGKRCILAYPDV